MTAAVELRMPLGYVEMDAEEMEYLEGGWYISRTNYYSSAKAAYKVLNFSAWVLYIRAACFCIGSACLGFAVGGPAGAAIGAVGGVIGGSILWGWASACDNAAIDAKRLGNRSCRVNVTLQNFTMRVTVR